MELATANTRRFSQFLGATVTNAKLTEKQQEVKYEETDTHYRSDKNSEGFADVPQQVFKVKGKSEIERVSVERVHISDVIKKNEPFKTKFERIKLKQENLFV